MMNADVNIPLSLENSHDAEDTQEVNNTGVERRNSVEVTMNRNKEATEKSSGNLIESCTENDTQETSCSNNNSVKC